MNLFDRVTKLEQNERSKPIDIAAARDALLALLNAHSRGEALPQIHCGGTAAGESEAHRKLLMLLERKAAERQHGTENAGSH